MFGTLASAAVVVCGALLVGQAVLRLCGATAWSWLSPPVGAAVLMLIAVPALHVPGRSAGTAVVLVLAVLAACFLLLNRGVQLPPVRDLLAGVPVALLTMVPFVGAERFGTLGWSFNNDMASHLALAEAYRSQAAADVYPLLADYPLGPHALAATLAELLGVGVDQAFAGLTLAAPILLGLTALAYLRRARWWGPVLTVTLAGMPFLVASYYGQGSFKELYQALFTFGLAGWLLNAPTLRPVLRWVPVALLSAGTISVYSVLGLAWPALFIALWLFGEAARRLVARRPVGALLGDARRSVMPAAVGLATLIVVIGPQLPRIYRFASNRSGAGGGIAKDDIGNLAGPIRVWEAFGIWGNKEYRFPAVDQFAGGMWAAFAVALVVLGVFWAVRRGDWLIPLATAGALVIWWYSDRTQSAYVAAKALVVLSPFLLLLAVRPLAETDPDRRMPSWFWVAAPVIAAVFGFKAIDSSFEALRFSKVGPTDHARELQSLRPTLGTGKTLFLGNDDFVLWELSGVRVDAPVIGFPRLPLRPEKPWTYGQQYDIDSLAPSTANQFDWVVSPRDAAASAMPPQLRLVRRTRNFSVYRRTATIPPRSILAEGQDSSAVLDCTTPAGRLVRRRGGVAAVRALPIGVEVPALPPGGDVTVELALPVGTWDLVTPYNSERRVRVRTDGLDTTLPANLDRPGTRWPIGRVRVSTAAPLRVRMDADDGPLTDDSAVTTMGAVVAVPVGTSRKIPVAAACGLPVDFYQPARP